MINLFTRKLPKDLSRILYFEYQRFHQSLKQLCSSEWRNVSESQFELLEILLGMAVFYNLVLKELESAASFSHQMTKRDVPAIQIGSYLLDASEAKKIRKAVRHFHFMMSDFGIEETMFDFSDAKTFLKKNIEFVKSW